MSCPVCGLTEFRRTADDVFICANGHVNADMQVEHVEFEAYNTQMLSQMNASQQPIKEHLFGQQEYLMLVDAIQYLLVKYTQQLEVEFKLSLLPLVYELWMSWLMACNVGEEMTKSVKISHIFGIMWIACQYYKLPISSGEVVQLITPIELPSRYKAHISKAQYKYLNTKLVNLTQDLYPMLDYFDYVRLPPPNIQLYSAYIIHGLKLPLDIVEKWYSIYNGRYWDQYNRFFRLKMDQHVIWSIYAYLLILFERDELVPFGTFISNWFKHLEVCQVKCRNHLMREYLNNQFRFGKGLSTKESYLAVPTTTGSFKTKQHESSRFVKYAKEAYESVRIPPEDPAPCRCFNSDFQYTQPDRMDLLLERLMLYLFCDTFTKANRAIQQSEVRLMRHLTSK